MDRFRSTKLTIILVLILMIASMPAGFAAGSSAEGISEEGTAIQIAALLPLSGDLASKGTIRQAAIELAVEAANERWSEQGTSLRFELIIRDSGSDPATALSAAQKLYDEGVGIFIVGSSAEVERLKPWADEQGAIVISYSSTTPALAAADDSVFRMVPDDSNQAQALAAVLVEEGIYGFVPVFRDDVYGQQLYHYLQEEFATYYGITTDPVIYSSGEDDWDNVAMKIADRVDELNMLPENKAVVMLSFDEAAHILASSDPLHHIRWFGGDTVALSPAILEDPAAADAAENVRLTAVTFGMPEIPEAIKVQELITRRADEDFVPDAWFAYDIPGLLAHAIEQLEDPSDLTELHSRLVDLSSGYLGVTGWTLLDDNGDRKYYRYDVWQVGPTVETADMVAYAWERVMEYTRNPGAPGYLVPTEQEPQDLVGSELSVLFGYGEDMNLGREVSRAEFIYMLVGVLGLQPTLDATALNDFTDASHVDARAKDAVRAAWEHGILTGYVDGTLRPEAPVSIAEALVMVSRGLKLSDSAEDDPAEPSTTQPTELLAPAWAKAHIDALIRAGLFVPLDAAADDVNRPLSLADASMIMINLMNWSDEG